jgi:Flp pilus assembly protein TadG
MTAPFRFLLESAKLIRDQTGSALVEATILMPVMLILFLGVFEFSWVYNQQQLVEIGIRDAARYLSRTATGNPCSQAGIVTNAKNLATTGTVDASTPKRVAGWGTTNVDIQCDLSTDKVDTFLGGTPYIITVKPKNFTYPSLGFFGYFGLTSPNISFTHAERNIGPG